ncbi:MAG TPA: hypothetical protein VD931_01530 [Baekduia sp.]|nr:hypothetical protein [Baekduia sp.]
MDGDTAASQATLAAVAAVIACLTNQELGGGVAAGTPTGGPGSAGGTATQNFGRRG